MLKTGRGLAQLAVTSHSHHLQLISVVLAELPAQQNQNFHSQPVNREIDCHNITSIAKTTVQNITMIIITINSCRFSVISLVLSLTIIILNTDFQLIRCQHLNFKGAVGWGGEEIVLLVRNLFVSMWHFQIQIQ